MLQTAVLLLSFEDFLSWAALPVFFLLKSISMASSSSRDDPLSFSNLPTPIPLSDGEGSLPDPNSQIGSASGSLQNDGLSFSAIGDSRTHPSEFSYGAMDGGSSEADFGFRRPGFGEIPLLGTVEMHDRHVFLCYKNPQVWPPRVEAAEFDRLPRLLSAALAARKGAMKKEVFLFRICSNVSEFCFFPFASGYGFLLGLKSRKGIWVWEVFGDYLAGSDFWRKWLILDLDIV